MAEASPRMDDSVAAAGWANDPSPVLAAVFADIAATRMRDLPICNPHLQVEAIGFRRRDDGHWAGVMITPWAINILCLPGATAGWPGVAAGGTHEWRFPSGPYEFTVAEEARLGVYHLCSLFSPATDFPSHDQARLTALAAAHALFGDTPVDPPADMAVRPPVGRRAFLGLGR